MKYQLFLNKNILKSIFKLLLIKYFFSKKFYILFVIIHNF